MRSLQPFLLLLPGSLSILLMAGCDRSSQEDTNKGQGTQVATSSSGQEDGSWRQPAALFSTFPPYQGKTVLNMYAGDGFYAFELVRSGANVIATDPDPENVRRMEVRKKELGLGDDRLRVRLASPDAPGVGPGEADLALCVHTYMAIPDRINYLRKVRAMLPSPAPLILVDFNPAPSPVGPPMDQRVSDQFVMDEMELVGGTDIGGFSKKLPYQWIVVCMDFVPGPDFNPDGYN